VYDSLVPPPPFSVSSTAPNARWDYAPGLRSWHVPGESASAAANDGTSSISAEDGDALVFESRFESGNLRRAVRVGPREYDLVLQPDLNTSSHAQWYFFAVRNGRGGAGGGEKGGGSAGGSAGGGVAAQNQEQQQQPQPYRFNIINLLKPDSLYNSGLRPLAHSAARQRREGVGWARAGESVAYHATPVAARGGSAAAAATTTTTTSSARSGRARSATKKHSTLTFEYSFLSDDDLVHFAHCYPYTYTDLQRELHAALHNLQQQQQQQQQQQPPSPSSPSPSPSPSPSSVVCCTRDTLCTTLAGNACDMLTITAPPHEGLPVRERRGVVLSARVHPGETNASWMMRGALRELLSPSSEAARALRGRFVFKVAPMLNPDGVACGNYRCSLAGVDLNRVYAAPCERAHPTIAAFKRAVAAFSEERDVVLLADLHGHSRKLGVFAYGCDPDEARKLVADPSGPGGVAPGSRGALPGVPRQHQARLFPLLLHAAAPDLFSFAACSFRVARSKSGTGRVVAFAGLGLANALTVEASFCGPGAPVLVPAADGKGPPRLRRVHFNTSHLERMGQVIVRTLLDYGGEAAAAAATTADGAEAAAAALSPPPLPSPPSQQQQQQQQEQPLLECPKAPSLMQQMLQHLEVLAEAEAAAAELATSGAGNGKATGQRRPRSSGDGGGGSGGSGRDGGGGDGGGGSGDSGVRIVQTRRGPVLEVVGTAAAGEGEDDEEDVAAGGSEEATDSEDEDDAASRREGGAAAGRRRQRQQPQPQQARSPVAQRRAALERMRERRRQLLGALGLSAASGAPDRAALAAGAQGEGEKEAAGASAAAAPGVGGGGSTAALQLLLAAASASAAAAGAGGGPPEGGGGALGELAAYFAASRAGTSRGGSHADSLGLLELAVAARPALLRMRNKNNNDDNGAGADDGDAGAAAAATGAAVAAVTSVRRAAATAAEFARVKHLPATGGSAATVAAGGVEKPKTTKKAMKKCGGARQRLKMERERARAEAAAAAAVAAAAADPVLLEARARAEAGLAVVMRRAGGLT